MADEIRIKHALVMDDVKNKTERYSSLVGGIEFINSSLTDWKIEEKN